MVVALVGIGVDDKNAEPSPRIYDDGSFEYIPIPEAQDTVEKSKYKSFARTHNGGNLRQVEDDEEALADALTEIRPQEEDGPAYRGEELASHPIHHDPNFAELTYGEVKTANQNQIEKLNPEDKDVLAFYTGLVSSDSDIAHRYIIGYFTVQEMVDFSSILGDDPPINDNERVIVDDLPKQRRELVRQKLEENSENAHAKRYQESGTIDSNLLIVKGTTPGGLLSRAFPISRTAPGGHAFTQEIENRFNVQTTKDSRETGFLGGYKKPHRLGISGADFIDIITDLESVG